MQFESLLSESLLSFGIQLENLNTPYLSIKCNTTPRLFIETVNTDRRIKMNNMGITRIHQCHCILDEETDMLAYEQLYLEFS